MFRSSPLYFVQSFYQIPEKPKPRSVFALKIHLEEFCFRTGEEFRYWTRFLFSETGIRRRQIVVSL